MVHICSVQENSGRNHLVEYCSAKHCRVRHWQVVHDSRALFDHTVAKLSDWGFAQKCCITSTLLGTRECIIALEPVLLFCCKYSPQGFMFLSLHFATVKSFYIKIHGVCVKIRCCEFGKRRIKFVRKCRSLTCVNPPRQLFAPDCQKYP